MKFLTILVLSLCITWQGFTQNVTVKGRAVDNQTKKAVSEVSVNIQTTERKTDENGNFEFSVTPGNYVVTFISDDWSANTMNIKVTESGLDMGDITFVPKTNSSNESGVAEVTLSDSDFDNDK